jgi:hypothetical protein
MTLKILDCSNFIYTGDVSHKTISRGIREVDGKFVPNEAKIGAIQFLLYKVKELMGSDSIVVPVFDRTPEIKRQAYYDFYGDPYGYKAGRSSTTKTGTTKEQISLIKEYAEYILRSCGFPVQVVEGYEADDVIYTLWKDNLEYYDKIEIYTGDSDLYFLVTENCEIHPVRKGGKFVDLQNYSTVVCKDSYIHYNTIHFYKLYKGDTGDNIPGVGFDWAPMVDACIENESDYKHLGDLDFARSILMKIPEKFPKEVNASNLLDVFNLLVPYYINDDIGGQLSNDSISDEFFNYYLKGFNEDSGYEEAEDKLKEYIDSFNR